MTFITKETLVVKTQINLRNAKILALRPKRFCLTFVKSPKAARLGFLASVSAFSFDAAAILLALGGLVIPPPLFRVDLTGLSAAVAI